MGRGEVLDAHAPADQPVAPEGDGREPGDEGSVHVEEGTDLRPGWALVDLPSQPAVPRHGRPSFSELTIPTGAEYDGRRRNAPLSADFVQNHTGGTWVPFTMLSNVDPVLNLQRYFVEGEMSDPAASAEIRYASFSVFGKE